MILQLKLIGSILMILALVHIIFPKYFKWDEELKSLSLVNKEIMIIHTFFIALMVFLNGLLCILESNALIETRLGKVISLGIGIFWSARLFIQFFGYSSELWKGKKFETIVHIAFSILWAYLSFIFLYIFFS